MNNSSDTLNRVEKKNSDILNKTKKSHSNNLRRLIITDVSRMEGDKICIFGIDADYNPIRPTIPIELIHEYRLFDKERKHVVKPFAMIEFDMIRHYPNPPHIEDYIINPCSKPVFIRDLGGDEAEDFLKSILYDDVKSIFGTRIFNNKYIPEHCGTRSIGTVEVKRLKRIKVSVDNKGNPHPRIVFLDSSGEEYDLPITDCAFRKYYQNHLKENINLAIINSFIESIFQKGVLYVRVGLSRAWSKNSKNKIHYLLLTGIYSFPDYKRYEIP